MSFELAAFADEADGRISEQIKAMTRNGIKYLEIRGVDGENISDISKEKAKEVYRQLDDSGLSVWAAGIFTMYSAENAHLLKSAQYAILTPKSLKKQRNTHLSHVLQTAANCLKADLLTPY